MILATARDAWRDLEAKLRPFVGRRVRSPTDVDDVLQDIFLRMQRSLATLRDEERFGPWVYRIARNAVADHWRAAPLAALEDREIPAELAREEDEDERTVEKEVALYLTFFIAALPSPYREALTLTELEGLTQREAATMLGISVSGMKSRVQRGRRRLRSALEACCEIALDPRGRVIACEPRPDGRLPEGCCCDPPSAGANADRGGAVWERSE